MSKDERELTRSIEALSQRMMVSIDATFAMIEILSERVSALEQHAKGMSFEDIVDGKDPKIGPTAEHVERLQQLRAALEALN